ncbi:hypothetical protein [Microvirga massiliensis]|uniref:hypothetical protein n=1 Tax=Microvirga massiliensis TaxID=1033741 RepID=UPI00062B3F5F|nr:hypothetical protein [Microvirga massiliensis]
MFRIVGMVMLVFAGTAAAADEFPGFDIEAICRAAPRLLPSETDTYQNCVRDETEARNQLERQWASFNAGLREECVRDTSVGGSPSFVDVLTCIQMAVGMPASMPHRLRRTP